MYLVQLAAKGQPIPDQRVDRLAFLCSMEDRQMTIADRLKDLENQAGDLQQALIDAHEWQALNHLQNAMHELWQAQTCTAARCLWT